MRYFVRKLQEYIRIKQKYMVNVYLEDEFGVILFEKKNIAVNTGQLHKEVILIDNKPITITLDFRNQSSLTQNNAKFFPEQEHQALQQIAAQIRQNLSRNFTIEELSSLAGMNRTKLQSGFKLIFGKTINTFTKEMKMQEAITLLNSEVYISLKEVAAMVGYKHTNHFSAAFKKYYSFSPSSLKGKSD